MKIETGLQFLKCSQEDCHFIPVSVVCGVNLQLHTALISENLTPSPQAELNQSLLVAEWDMDWGLVGPYLLCVSSFLVIYSMRGCLEMYTVTLQYQLKLIKFTVRIQITEGIQSDVTAIFKRMKST